MYLYTHHSKVCLQHSLSSKLQPHISNGLFNISTWTLNRRLRWDMAKTGLPMPLTSPAPSLSFPYLSKMAPASIRLLKPRIYGHPWFLSFSQPHNIQFISKSCSPERWSVSFILPHVSISFACHSSLSYHKAEINIFAQCSRMDIDIRCTHTNIYVG